MYVDSRLQFVCLLGVIFNALNLLNEKFSGDIQKTLSSTFPDEYFTCSAKCLSCGGRCKNSMNHHRDSLPHSSDAKCVYQHQFENKRYYCRQCFDRGDYVQVVPKTAASNEGTWLGLATYALSGYVLECSRCGVIYRSRQYWYVHRCSLASLFADVFCSFAQVRK